VLRVVPIQSVGTSKDCRRLLKRDAMFFKVGNRLRDISRKHIRVYTLMRPPVARTEDADDLCGLSGLSGLWGKGDGEVVLSFEFWVLSYLSLAGAKESRETKETR
jgi:hypothetical protein